MTARIIRNFVGGAFLEPDESGCYDKISPIDGSLNARVSALVPFDTEQEAIALANDTEYGLASGIGREGGDHSLDFDTEPTNICIQI